MSNGIYLIISIVYVIMIRAAWRLRTGDALQYRLFLVILAALLYDNAVNGIGFMIGPGPVLKFLNFFRFAFHVFFTPLLCYVVFAHARTMQVSLAQRRHAAAVVWLLVCFFMASGFLHDIVPMDLVPQEMFGVVNYTHAQHAVPLPVILINVFVLWGAFLIWRQARRPALFITSLFVFCCAALPISKYGLLPGNVGELVLACGFLRAQNAVDGS